MLPPLIEIWNAPQSLVGLNRVEESPQTPKLSPRLAWCSVITIAADIIASSSAEGAELPFFLALATASLEYVTMRSARFGAHTCDKARPNCETCAGRTVGVEVVPLEGAGAIEATGKGFPSLAPVTCLST